MKPHSMKTFEWILILTLATSLPMATISLAKGKTALSSAAKAGKKEFEQNCAMCHFANQTKSKIAPGLKGLFKRKELPYSHKPVTVANVEEQIEKGNPQGKPMPMPPFGDKLSKTQLKDLVAYLKTL